MTEAAGGDALTTLGINGKLLLAQLFNVGIILFIVWRWVYWPLLRLMDARGKKIEEGLQNAERAQQALKDSEAQKTALLRAARQEAQKILAHAQAQAEAERKQLLAQAQADLERQLQEAKRRLQAEKESSLRETKRELADLILLATEKVVGKTVSVEVQHKLVQETIREMPS